MNSISCCKEGGWYSPSLGDPHDHPEMGQATLFMSELPGPGGAASEPFGTSDRTFKGVMRSSGGSAKAWYAMPTRGSGECGTASGRKKSDLRANQGRPESCACVRPSCCQVSTWAGLGAGLAFFLKARSIRGNITIKQTTAMEAASRIRNVVTIRSPSISSQLICPKRSMGSQNGGPRLVRNA